MNIHTITLEVETADEVDSAERFYGESFGLSGLVDIGIASAPSSGFRGFAPSLILEQPADVDVLFERAVVAGAQVLKPVVKSLWGYGGSLRAPEGTVWQVASASKKNTGDSTGKIERLVLLVGVTDVKASKRFYENQGVTVAKSFGGKYVEFSSGDVTLALYKRGELAKQVGVEDAAGAGSHRVAVVSDGDFADPDGFNWVSACATSPAP